MSEHRMIAGSHERRTGPVCVCGRVWNYWVDKCEEEGDLDDVQPTADELPFWNGDYDSQYVQGCSNCDGGGCGDCVIA